MSSQSESGKTRRVVLRQFGREDFARLIEWSGDAEFLMQWSGPWFKYPLDVAQLETYLKAAEADRSNMKVWKGVIEPEGATIGHIGLSNIDPRHDSATLSRVLVGEPRMRGLGVGRAMILEALKEGFIGLGLHRIDLFVMDFNDSAIACYKKLGFETEGLIRECRKVGDARWSVIQMALLAPDFKKLHVSGGNA